MHVAILGAGKVGITIATILQNSKFCREIRLGDIAAAPDLNSASRVQFETVDFTDAAALHRMIAGSDAVVSAAPFYLNRTIAEVCAAEKIAYFDLTENVETTGLIRDLARDAAVPFMRSAVWLRGQSTLSGAVMRAYSRRSEAWSCGSAPCRFMPATP